MKQIEELARAAIGIDTQRGDVLAVENLSFQEMPLETPLPPTKTEHWRRLLEPWVWMLRYVGLAALFVVVYFLILRPVKKQAMTAFRELPKKITAHNAAQTLPGSTAANALEHAWGDGIGGTANQRAEEDADRQSESRAGGGQPAGGILGAGRPGDMKNERPVGHRFTQGRHSMVLLGEDAASQIYRHLPPSEVEQVTQEITALDYVNPETALVVLEEFHRLVITGDYVTQGGTEYANKLLVKAFGKEGASELLRQVSQAAEISGAKLDSLRKIDPQQLAKFIEGEHPQTIALISGPPGIEAGVAGAAAAAEGVAGGADQAAGPVAAILAGDGAARVAGAEQADSGFGRANPASLRRAARRGRSDEPSRRGHGQKHSGGD